MDTNINFSPHSILPAPEPCIVDPPIDYFYDNVAKHLIRDTVRLMSNGLPIDLNRVIELEKTLDETLETVTTTLANNPYIKQYLELRYSNLVNAKKTLYLSRCKSASDFLVPFDAKKPDHRHYFMHIFASQQGMSAPSDLLPTGIAKWPVNTIKKFVTTYPVLKKLLDGSLSSTHPIALAAMELFAEHKADLYNRSRIASADNADVDTPTFNPNSSDQLRELFDMLGYESEKLSKTTGKPSWERKQIERLMKETDDPILKELTSTLIDFSFGNIIKTTFVPAFYRYTVDGRLYGQYVLFGAKSFRYTSKLPNMLNTPSTGSIYAKPVKRCFVAPDDFLVYAIDLSALEDRVMASLSRDTNKCNIFLQNLDGHCLNAYGYFPEEIAQYMPITNDIVTDVKHFFDLQEHGHKELKAIRQRGKPATFGLNYGAYPPKVAATLKISLAAAQALFDNYHNVLYKGITTYREEYVLPTSESKGRIHLGLGCYLKTDNAKRDIRTLTNATCQFWSILTALTINRMHQLIDEAGLTNDIQCTSTIYDSIYFIVRKDSHIIKWLNDNIVPLITTDFMENQTIHNEAAGEIGLDWASLFHVPNNASLPEIKATMYLIDNPDHELHKLRALKDKTDADLELMEAIWSHLIATFT